MQKELLTLYPMIHKDKLIYQYEESKVRVGTDDNDVLEIKNKDNRLFPVLKMMDGANNVNEILQTFKWLDLKTLSLLIVSLSKHHSLTILDKPLNKISGYEKFKSDFTYYCSEGFDGEKIIEKLKNLKVTIYGVGGGGSVLALQLGNLGVKHLHLVDNDRVDESNLHRQFLFKNSDVGRHKVDVVKEFLKNRNPNMVITNSKTKITSVDKAIKEIEDADWAFCCIDEPPYISQRIINRASFLKGIPSLYGFSSRDSCKMLMVNPNKSACVDCLLNSRDNVEFQTLISALQESEFSPTTPIIIPNLMLEASWMAKKWLDQVINRRQQWNILYRFDFNKLKEENFVIFDKQVNCPTCGRERTDSELWKIIPIK